MDCLNTTSKKQIEQPFNNSLQNPNVYKLTKVALYSNKLSVGGLTNNSLHPKIKL